MGGRGGPDDHVARDWVEETYAYATVHLGWPPSDFWSATPYEFWAAQKAFEQKVRAINAST